jgi:AmiR/NasT family two-component response regulator
MMGNLAISDPVDEQERLRRLVVQLKEKLAGQPVIEQAKGMLMQTFGLSADEAFGILRVMSQNRNVRLRSIADSVVESGMRRGPRPDFDAACAFLLMLPHEHQGTPRGVGE